MADSHEITVTEKPNNMPPYRWEATCECGWQARMDNEAAVSNAGAMHQVRRGYTSVQAAEQAEAAPASKTTKRSITSS